MCKSQRALSEPGPAGARAVVPCPWEVGPGTAWAYTWAWYHAPALHSLLELALYTHSSTSVRTGGCLVYSALPVSAIGDLTNSTEQSTLVHSTPAPPPCLSVSPPQHGKDPIGVLLGHAIPHQLARILDRLERRDAVVSILFQLVRIAHRHLPLDVTQLHECN